MSVARLGAVDARLREIALEALGNPSRTAPASDSALARLAGVGTRLWLDTGNLEEAASLWKAEFSALTTNNTLANQVVQTGVLDDTARETVREIRTASPGISAADLVMELGFVINCHVALRLVRAFGAFVSVELHPSVAENIERTVEYARRYFAVCPERFIIKIPLTPEGYCAVARVIPEGIPVNYTLGFSARQNYIAALMSNPTYVNVFLGRLNAVVSDNGLGDGVNVGEKASMACQNALLDLRGAGRTGTLLIAASMRSAPQVLDLAGTDVYTIPPKVVREFLAAGHDPAQIVSRTACAFPVEVVPEAGPVVEPLWSLSDGIKALGEQVAGKGATITDNDLRAADADCKAGLFRAFSVAEKETIRTDGKIPVTAKWSPSEVALDDLMTQSALQSFAVDQAALDDRLLRLSR